MRIHHLNACTMCPASARLVNGRGGLFKRARLVCHVLLLETNQGLVLVDTGLGTNDIADPKKLGKGWLRLASPRLLKDETAIEQIRALGHSPEDVRHIVLTHLDRDHAGGIMDFPRASVHVHGDEHLAAVNGGLPVRKGRYLSHQWDTSTNWVRYNSFGEDWFGFSGVRTIDDQNPDVLMIPLPGHTPGHCGVAVRTANKWLLHAGDSYYFHGQIKTPSVSPPLGLDLFQKKADTDRAIRIANQERLRELNCQHQSEVDVFCSHDPYEYDNHAARCT